jgi:hypothetical protein
MNKFLPLSLALTALTACAPSAMNIAPVDLGNAYAGLGCAQAVNALAVEQAKLTALSSAQDSAVMGDAIGVALIGIPVSSLVGKNHAAEIGTAKGKVLALQARVGSCQ